MTGEPILLDPRTGSKELMPALFRVNVPFDVQLLEFADVAFIGHGPHGLTPIGIERKTVRDLVQSLISSRLNGYQLPGITRAYEYRWIVIEGTWRIDKDTGLVQVPRFGASGFVDVEPRLDGESLLMWITTLQLLGRVQVWQTYSLLETAQFIKALRQWWTGKEWHEHRGHLAFYTDPRTLYVKPTLTYKWAAALDGIGFTKAEAVEAAFRTPFALACAGETEWRTITGIGKVLASRIVRAIHGDG